MITTRAEIIVALGKTASWTAAEDALLELVHIPAESALLGWLGHSINYQQHTEYLPLPSRSHTRDYDYPLEDAELSGNDLIIPSSAMEARRNTLQLKNLPVFASGLKVYEDESAYAGQGSEPWLNQAELTQGTDFYLDVDDGDNQISNTGLLYRIVGSWATTPRSIKVVYWAGLSAADLATLRAGEVKLAAVKTVVHNYFALKNARDGAGGAKISENIGRYAYTRDGSSAAVMGGAGIAVPPQVQADLFHRKNLGRLFAG